MKRFMQKYQKVLVSGAVCLVLALALAAGSWAALSADRTQPDAPKAQEYPGLNIDQIGLRYDQQSQTQDGAAGDGAGDGPAQQDDTQPQDDAPPQEVPKPDQITVDEPDPGEDPQPDQDKTDDDTPGDGPADEDKKDDQQAEPQIASSLRDQTITQEELKDGMFSFMAKVLNGQDDTYLRARIKNSETNGRWITASGEDYTTRLALGRNEITLLLKRGSEIIGQVTYVINYRAAMANADEPEKGLNPPKIRTNLGGDVVTLTNRNLTFTVWATDGDENPINQNHVTVMMDGKVVKHSTGDAVNGLEYNLFLDTGIAGDETEHTVTIVAWDDKGNSTYKSYKIIYKVRDTGEKIGTATIRLDLTVLGLGLVDVPVSQDIFQDVPASHAVVAALEYLGYDVDFDGSLDTGFYLTRITRSRSFKGAEIPEELRRLLELDGLSIRLPDDGKNSVGEFDYTMGSGWMYCVNGAYPGRGMSEYFLSDGDTLTLRFTLAKGKDIGGSTGGNTGALQKYCGTWIDGRYIPNHTYKDGVCAVCGAVDPAHTHNETEEITRPATCTEPGEKTYTCSICGENRTEAIPAAGHHYENGVCTVCGQSDPDAKPEPTPEPDPGPDPKPEPGTDPEPTPDPNPGGEETQNETTA